MPAYLHDYRGISKKLTVVAISTTILFTCLSYVLIERYARFIVAPELPADTPLDVAIVFGGGVSSEGPRPLVRERLNTAKAMLDNGEVQKLLLSGDNRQPDYNEPQVMAEYLMDKGVRSELLELDFAGRSTYETCERARKVFQLEHAVLISEATHLPRALYLCRHFGIQAYGVASLGDAGMRVRIAQQWRELLARSKAVLNVYLVGEKTVLGETIDINFPENAPMQSQQSQDLYRQGEFRSELGNTSVE